MEVAAAGGFSDYRQSFPFSDAAETVLWTNKWRDDDPPSIAV